MLKIMTLVAAVAATVALASPAEARRVCVKMRHHHCVAWAPVHHGHVRHASSHGGY